MTKSALVCFGILAALPVVAADITRHANTASPLPISTAVEVDDLLFHSGLIPSPANPDAESGTREYWGDTEAQTHSVLGKLRDSLAAKGYSLADVVKLNVYLVGDPELSGSMDFGGFMAAYNQYFGEASDGQLPARTVVQIAGLVAPGMLVEIEAVAAR